MRSTDDSLKPIYVSIGHRVSLNTAIKIVKITCKYRVPEPIRQVDCSKDIQNDYNLILIIDVIKVHFLVYKTDFNF